MKHLKTYLLLLLPMLLLSCQHREIAYLSNAPRDSVQDIVQHYDATLLPGDIIYIYVSSQTPESVFPFNQETHIYITERNGLTDNEVSSSSLSDIERFLRGEQGKIVQNASGYLINEKGEIQFPVLGNMHVAGMTQDSLKTYIENELKTKGYVNDPVVTTRLLNFRVTVVGEVLFPQQILVNGTRITIFEALAQCGDMTDYGIRDSVVVVRTEAGKQVIGVIDLTSKEALNSPYYYLHNNDLVYIEPNKLKKKLSDNDEDIPRYISMGVSIANIVNSFYRRFVLKTERR